MIKIENIKVFNIDGAIRGMRNPLNSHDKSDSSVDIIGTNDIALAQKLIKAGTEHRKFMRQVFVSMDVTAPLYWWKEMETYKIATTSNSESTMHTLSKNPITESCFSFDQEFVETKCQLKVAQTPDYEWATSQEPVSRLIDIVVEGCENLRSTYLETKDIRYWRALIQLLPSSWNQKRTWTANYEVLLNIIQQRRLHKLSEWREFCEVVLGICPYLGIFHESLRTE